MYVNICKVCYYDFNDFVKKKLNINRKEFCIE